MKLEQLLSVGSPVRKIAKDSLLVRKLHHNTVHNFMARNYMQPVRQKFSTLSDDQLKLEITKSNLSFPTSDIGKYGFILKTKIHQSFFKGSDAEDC